MRMADIPGMRVERALTSHQGIEDAVDSILMLARNHLEIFDQRLGILWNGPARIAALRTFCRASPRNELHIALHDSSRLRQDCPRLVTLIQTFGHVISVRETRPEARQARDPMVIADHRHFVHRFHADASRATFSTDNPEGTQPLLERFREIWAASDPASPGTTLGL